MAITNIPKRSSSDSNASADINTLNSNDQDLQGQIDGISVGGAFTFFIKDNAYVDTLLQYIVARGSGTFSRLYIYAITAPVGSSLTIDINKNGTSILSSPLSITAGANSANTSSFATTTFVQDDRISIDIDAIGSSTAGADIAITLSYT